MALFGKKNKNKGLIEGETPPIAFDEAVQPTEGEPDADSDEISEEELARLAEMTSKFDEAFAGGVVVDFSGQALAVENPAPPGDDNIDAELWALINKDRAMTETVRASEDFDPTFIDEAAIYDTVERPVKTPEELAADAKKAELEQAAALETAEKEKEKIARANIFGKILLKITAPFTKNPQLRYYVIIGVLALLLVPAAALLLRLNSTINNQRTRIEAARGTIVTQPRLLETTNDANFIFINEAAAIGEDNVIILEKMLMDGHETALYFNKVLKYDDYRVTITDGDGYAYPLDLYYVLGDTNIERNKTAIHFTKMRSGVYTLTVRVEARATGAFCEYKLRVSGGTVILPEKHLNKPVRVMIEGESEGDARSDGALWIDDIDFSTGQTEVSFSLTQRGGKREITPDADKPLEITMRGDGGRVLPLTEKPLTYDFGGGYTCGVMRFNPLKRVGGTIVLTFANLMEKINVGTTIAAGSMFVKGDERAKTLTVYGKKLVLEGMQKQGAYYVLVAHAEDPNITAKPYDKWPGRVKAAIDAELTVYDADGGKHVIQGECRAETAGADILFPLGDNANVLRNADISQTELTIKSVTFELPQVSAEIDIDKMVGASNNAELLNVAASIEKSFTRRLDYKSGINSMASLTSGFSDDILSDFIIMKPYRPTRAFNPYAINTAQVQLLTPFSGDDDGEDARFYAIVYEYSDPRDDEPVFANIHKIVVVKNRREYVIVSDEIIR